jgi:hypothetical protein
MLPVELSGTADWGRPAVSAQPELYTQPTSITCIKQQRRYETPK